jgi:uncharacterized protein (DUF58 family)
MAELSVAEIVQKVRRIQIVANRVVDDLFAGEYHSVFRGRGMEFDEVREYQPGDEIRTIDWNVTARTGVPFVKRFREERELTVLFLVDISASGVFGSGQASKLDLVLEVAALLMFSALKNNDKVGLLMFCDEVHQYLPPRKGKVHILRFLRELVAVKPRVAPTRIDRALEFLNRVQKRRAVVFLISDFLAPEFERPLSISARRHDLVAVRVSDPRESDLPDVGFVYLEDAESGAVLELDSRHARVRELFAAQARRTEANCSQVFLRAGADELALNTAEAYTRTLLRFFRKRERRKR